MGNILLFHFKIIGAGLSHWMGYSRAVYRTIHPAKNAAHHFGHYTYTSCHGPFFKHGAVRLSPQKTTYFPAYPASEICTGCTGVFSGRYQDFAATGWFCIVAGAE